MNCLRFRFGYNGELGGLRRLFVIYLVVFYNLGFIGNGVDMLIFICLFFIFYNLV